VSALAEVSDAGRAGAARRGGLRWVLQRSLRRPVARAALVVLLALVLVGCFPDAFARYRWDEIDLTSINHAPELSGGHLFGTDQVGRDVLSRTIYGLHTTIEIGFAVALLAVLFGAIVGVLAGYYGRLLDSVMMRVVDVVTAYPAVVISLAAIVYLRRVVPHTLILLLAVYLWTVAARVVRAQVAAVKESEFVEAARAAGASDVRVIGRHVLPNIAGTLLVVATGLLGQAVLLDATIEFFSYGMPASTSPSLGNLIADVTNSGGLGVSAYQVLGWWTWLFPGLVLALLLVAINILGDAIDEALNPALTA
jgi:peptide/nickel transport system permease protein